MPLRFTPARRHQEKDLEQEQIAICFPGAQVTDDDFPVERVLLGILAGGMSGRLFTEVREKQGLAYWVGAWGDHPRTGGMLHVGASTTPQRVDQTYATLLREINRLAEDLTDDELQRAITGIVSQAQTRGDVTRSRAARLADDPALMRKIEFIDYWYNEEEGKVFCLCEAPSKEAAAAVHKEAHGGVADKVIEVKRGS